MNSKITTLLFDLDGTLVNTNDLVMASFKHTLDHYFPGKYTTEDILTFLGPPLYDSFYTVDHERVEEMILHYREFNMQQHDLMVKEYEGVFETVRALQAEGYKMAIVSTKIRRAILKGLEISRLAPFFDVIVALDDVTHAKPDPEPILRALQILNSKPEETIMVGDNYHDIEAGKNAGTYTAGVAWSIKGRDFLSSYNPDYMLDNMRDLLKILKVE